MPTTYSKILTSLHPSENPIVTLVPSAATINHAYSLNSNITIGSSFSPVYAVENQINLLLNSNVTGSSATYPQIRFRVNSVPTTGTTITISASTNLGDFPTFVMTGAAEPKFNEFYCDATLPTRTTEDVADSIVMGLNENFQFRQRFYAARNSSDIIIKSLAKGSRFNLDFSSSAGSISLISTTDSVDNVIAEGLKDYVVALDLYINSTGDFGSTLDRTNSTRVGQYENSFNKDNEYNFGLNGVLKNFVLTPLPTGTTDIQLLSGALVNFYGVYFAKYDEFRSNYARRFICGQTAISWGLNSSLDFLTENDLEPFTINNDDLLNIGTGTLPGPLTLAPDGKLTRANQKEYLTFLYHNYPSITDFAFNRNFYIQVRAEYWDGTFSAENSYSTTPIYSGGCYCVDVSPSIIGIPILDFSQRVKKYTVRLCCNSNHYLGEVQLFSRTYTYDSSPESRYPINLLFLGSPGGWDTWLCNGDTEVTTERKTVEFSSPLALNPTIEDEVTQIHSIEQNKIYKANTGYLDKVHYDWLYNEIGKSTNARLINSSGEFEYIIIKKCEGKYTSDENLFNVSIEFQKTVEENLIRR
jgi:hypothetical protein